ncbi:MAG: diphthine--ammonia ligase [Chitinophagales bacterium]|nr:diphthine--ammonia ligase [Chitinophagales bacterium]
MIKAAIFWSGGKDSALCLDEIMQSSEYQVAYLVTFFSGEPCLVSTHGIRVELLRKQAGAIGIPLKEIYVKNSTNAEYEFEFGKVMEELKSEEIHHVIFGDIFLEEIKSYRESLLADNWMKGVFPLWKKNTEFLLQIFLTRGYKAITCCVNSAFLDQSFAGIRLDFFSRKWLPSSIDVSGENGEYHTFVFDGPFFKNEVKFKRGEKVFRPLEIKLSNLALEKIGYWFIDLIPV